MNTIVPRFARTMRSFLVCAMWVLPALAVHAQEHRHGATPSPPATGSSPTEATVTAPAPKADHSQMDHGKMDHSRMDHGAEGPESSASASPKTPIPALTDADRAAANRPLRAPHHHGDAVHSLVVFNRFEAWDADPGTAIGWEGHAWIGTDTDRLWLRTEGERMRGDLEHADLEVLYGRSVSAWWDVVAGVRQDFGPGTSRTYASVGVIGLAPQKFEVKATLSLAAGQSTLRVEAERTLLLSGRWMLQPLIEANLFGRDDAAQGVGAGLSTMEVGLRLRYEVDRRFAPYVGVVHERAFGETADLRRAEDEEVGDTCFVAGIRFWF